jgi:hypothetical protein
VFFLDNFSKVVAPCLPSPAQCCLQNGLNFYFEGSWEVPFGTCQYFFNSQKNKKKKVSEKNIELYTTPK